MQKQKIPLLYRPTSPRMKAANVHNYKWPTYFFLIFCSSEPIFNTDQKPWFESMLYLSQF